MLLSTSQSRHYVSAAAMKYSLFPNEVYDNILSFLPLYSLFNFRRVGHWFRNACEEHIQRRLSSSTLELTTRRDRHWEQTYPVNIKLEGATDLEDRGLQQFRG